jgi:hypothetical protein
MSLNSILETARKLGIPVIITNDRGESPQVVMPFEDFASMVGVTTSANKRPRVSPAVREEEDEEIAQALVDIAREEVERAGEGEIRIEEEPAVPQKGDFVEDRFYFEPIEEESKG